MKKIQMNRPYADIHCHPSLKSYGHSFPTLMNSINHRHKNSIYYYDPPNLLEKFIDLLGGIVKYRQSDMSSLGFGNAGIICASLYPIERGFFDNKLGNGEFNDMLLSFITSVGDSRVDFVQKNNDYFSDLVNEYNFYKQLNDKPIKLIDNSQYKYVLAKNATDINVILNSDGTNNKKSNSIAVIMSIEGAHVFGSGIDPKNNPANKNVVLSNVSKVKDWEFRPLFITMAHHFYNELCGHAKSLTGIVGKATDQRYGMNLGFTELGKEVVKALLDNSDGKRIYIDIKHMSVKSRVEYFKMLNTDFKGEDIPIIVSHGAVVGSPHNLQLFLNEDINVFDEEILLIAKTNGLLGLQLDERRITAPKSYNLRKSHSLERRKVLFHASYLVWLQIQHIAELLDKNGMFGWGVQCIGSDYDGVINPINGYWTAENLPTLEDYLLKHAYNYMSKEGQLLNVINRLDPEEIISRVMGDNAYRFIMKYYN